MPNDALIVSILNLMGDSISSLPDEILGKLLSLVPTKVAASTSVLSKRWRNLLSLVDSLSFDESMVVYPNEEEATKGSQRFCDFVDKTLALLHNSPAIKTFSLCRVAKTMSYNDESARLNRHTQWGLFRYGATFGGGGGGTVVEHASIKRLVIATHVPHHIDYYLLLEYFENACQTVRFQAPSLVYLDYSSFVFRKYDVGDLDSLVEARLSLKLWRSTSHYDYDDDYYYDYNGSLCDDDDPSPPIFGDVTCLVAAIRNITTLHLSPDSLEVFHFCCKSMPIFNNLLNLSIESNNQNGWQVMPLLLKSCPNLQTLVFKGLVHKVTNRCGDACACNPQNPSLKNSKKMKKKKKICCLQTCPVKVLEISDYGGCFQEVEQMRHFLGNLKCLETVKVGVDPDNKGKNAEFLLANLMNLPKLSSKCTIQLL
ncbi:BnaCnng18690D [Brassica napus]|uniref:BnaCnng18690D protein n=1 Tax=Brassica napus TaxID=3708 RepID=A0A078IJI6_BRANA|nr:BnaCnng18690D [Brassica napus]